MVLNLSNLKEEITVNKVALEESFKFKVTVPWDIDYEALKVNTASSYNKTMGNVLVSNQIKE